MKETQELKTRANSGMSNSGVRGGSEHSFGLSGSIQISSNKLGKVGYRKQNGSVASILYSASPTLRATGQTWNEQPSPRSTCFNADNRRQSIGTGDMIDSSLQPSSGSQSTWVESTSGHVSLADIIRIGSPQSKGLQMPCETSYTPQDAVPPNSAIYQMKPSLATSTSQLGMHQDLHSSDLNMTRESGKKSCQHDFHNEWPVNEPIKASNDIGATMYSNQSYLHSNRANLSSNCWSDKILVSESNAAKENLSSDHVNCAQVSSKQIFMNYSGGTSEHDDDLCKDTSSPDSNRQIYKQQEEKGLGNDGEKKLLSISSRYRGSASSIKNPTASMSEVLNSGAFPVSHPSSQALHGANLATGPVPKEHLSAHSYSQTGHPAIPQGHTYTASALQQAYPDGNMFHKSHAGMKYHLPHYRSASMSSFPLSGSYTSGYQSLGNSADILGSFLRNLSAGPAGGKVGYDDILRSQYRDGGTNFNLLQQNDGSARWDYGHGSRTISTIPDSAYYHLQGQNHRLAGYQQGQQHSQLHGALGYPGVYNSQAGITIEQQQQQKLHNMILMVLKAHHPSNSHKFGSTATNILLFCLASKAL
ncbi:hypothetical protein CRYUN_Cryun22dG0040100 [Craigia yunnanensis]